MSGRSIVFAAIHVNMSLGFDAPWIQAGWQLPAASIEEASSALARGVVCPCAPLRQEQKRQRQCTTESVHDDFSQRSCQVEAVQVHHLVPRGHEIMDELLLRVRLP